jgi:hypothetical protein
MGRRFWGGGRLEKAIYGGYSNIGARWEDGGKKPGCLVPLQHIDCDKRQKDSMSEQAVFATCRTVTLCCNHSLASLTCGNGEVVARESFSEVD